MKKPFLEKTVNWSSYDVNSDSNEDSDEESENENENENDSDNDDEDDDETEHHHLDGLYSLMGKRPHDSSSNGDDDDDDDDDNNNKTFSVQLHQMGTPMRLCLVLRMMILTLILLNYRHNKRHMR